jgi:uncharacterized protein (DUF433 family)
MTSRKYQISWNFRHLELRKYQISEHLEKYQISGNFRHLNIEKISDIWELQLPWHRENIRCLGIWISEYRENIRTGNFRHLNIEKISEILEFQTPEHRENIRYLDIWISEHRWKYHQISGNFRHLNINEIQISRYSDIWTLRKYQKSWNFRHLNIDENIRCLGIWISCISSVRISDV